VPVAAGQSRLASMLEVRHPARGPLLAALRTWRGANAGEELTIDELKRLLLSERGIGMNESAAASIMEHIFQAHGSTVTCEQVASLLVPLHRVQHFEDLSEPEMCRMRAEWAPLVRECGGTSADGSIDAGLSMLRKAAARVHGLVPGDAFEPDTDCKIIAQNLRKSKTQEIDLPTTFELFRAQQTKAMPPSTHMQLFEMLSAFDDDQSGSLSAEKMRRILTVFDGPIADIAALIQRSLVDGAVPSPAGAGAKVKERPGQLVSIKKMLMCLQGGGIQVKKSR